MIRPRFIAVGPHRVHLLESGQSHPGPPVLLLASMLVRAESYRPILAALSRYFHTFVVALPGSGSSSSVYPPWPMSDYARFTADLIGALNLGPVILVGHSNSAAPALLCAAERPELLGRLVLADPIGFGSSRSLTRVILGRAIDALLEPILTTAGLHHILLNLAAHPRTMIRQTLLSASTNLREPAAKVHVPTLLIWGALDHTMPTRWSRDATCLLPKSRLHIIPGASHDCLITRAHAVAQVLNCWPKEFPATWPCPNRGCGP